MEIGNLLFGYSRGAYPFPDRAIADSDEWLALCGVLGIDSHGCTEKDNPHRSDTGGYDDGVICVNPYWWGSGDESRADEPNFLDRRIGLEIRWYKYPFRDSYMNWQMGAESMKKYFGGLALSMMARRYEKEYGYGHP